MSYYSSNSIQPLSNTGASTSTLNGSSVTVTAAGTIVLASTSRYCSQDEIRYRTAASSVKCTETVANAYTRLHDAAVTSIAETWTQATSGAGGNRSISGQRGFAGSDGGDITIAVGEAGTTGTNTPGDLFLNLGTRSSGGHSGKVSLLANGASVLDIWNWNTGYTRLDVPDVFYVVATGVLITGSYAQIGGSSGALLTMQSAYCTLDSATSLEVGGQMSSDTNDVAFSATPTLSCALSNHHRIGALTANITTLDASNLRDGAVYTVMVTQDGTGAWTIGWAAKFKFGTTYTNVPDATASSVTIWTFLCDGTNLRCIGKEVGLT